MSDNKRQTNQGEGDRESARRYNEATQDFVESGGVEQHEKERKHGKVSRQPSEAEREGLEHVAEEDPAVKRKYNSAK